MAAPFIGVNIIGKRQEVAAVVIRVLQGDFHGNPVMRPFNVNRRIKQGIVPFIQVFNVVTNPPFIVERFLGWHFGPAVFDRDL